MVEGTRLENEQGRKSLAGWNPAPSANSDASDGAATAWPPVAPPLRTCAMRPPNRRRRHGFAASRSSLPFIAISQQRGDKWNQSRVAENQILNRSEIDRSKLVIDLSRGAQAALFEYNIFCGAIRKPAEEIAFQCKCGRLCTLPKGSLRDAPQTTKGVDGSLLCTACGGYCVDYSMKTPFSPAVAAGLRELQQLFAQAISDNYMTLCYYFYSSLQSFNPRFNEVHFLCDHEVKYRSVAVRREIHRMHLFKLSTLLRTAFNHELRNAFSHSEYQLSENGVYLPRYHRLITSQQLTDSFLAAYFVQKSLFDFMQAERQRFIDAGGYEESGWTIKPLLDKDGFAIEIVGSSGASITGRVRKQNRMAK